MENICDVLRDLVLFAQFKKHKNNFGGVLLLAKFPADLLKVTFFFGCFHLFQVVQMILNCAKHLISLI